MNIGTFSSDVLIQLCWILCPTVELASQQYNVVLRQLPAFQARFLSGADNVEYWTKQWIWDEVLKGIRVVVSTHQVHSNSYIS